MFTLVFAHARQNGKCWLWTGLGLQKRQLIRYITKFCIQITFEKLDSRTTFQFKGCLQRNTFLIKISIEKAHFKWLHLSESDTLNEFGSR